MFIPLHIYSEYSFLKSGLTIEKLVDSANKLGYKSLGIADLEVLHALPHFNELCLSKNITPICGMDIFLDGLLFSLYIKNEDGYQNLIKISKLIQLNELTKDSFLSHIKGLVCVISSSYINETNIELVKEYENKLEEIYIGMELYQKEDREIVESQLNGLSSSRIAFPHILYIKKEDAIVLEIVKAISEENTLDIRSLSGNHYLMKEEEISLLYSKEEINNTQKLLSLCNFTFSRVRGKMVTFTKDSKSTLKDLCYSGLKSKNIDDNKYFERLYYELSIIDKMHYNDYFLIVRDYVKYAKDNDIYVGPGRGSAAGSLVSYALDITTPDPIKYDLMFERFLNPDRVSMPDIDVDFEDVRREEIISYLKSRYDKSRVASIITYQTIGAKQALRDIGRVFKYDTHDIDYLSKSLGAMTVTFKSAYKSNPAFKKLVDSDSLYLEIVRLASKIEGLIRQSGIHAAGIILNDEPIDESLPVLIDQDNNLITQYEMNYLEAQGYLKMDILSLRNLTTIHNVMRLINRDDYYSLPYEDEEALKLIHDNITMGVFQLESRGMKNAINTLEPSTFDDVVALLALFRPGPMDAIPLYAKRKKSKEKIDYLNPIIEKILSPTYGIIVYQEQIMQIAVLMAGFSASNADNFRRAISKKDNSKLLKLKDEFINGSIKNGFSKVDATDVYEHIYKFADYGFNKAHSVSYAMISTIMAYLKAHYTLEFFSCLLDSESAFNNSKFNDYLFELKYLNINLLVPDINKSAMHFINEDGALRFPLTSIRGIPNNIIKNILEERETNGPYLDFFSFVSRCLPLGVNENHLTKLINAGAFDSFANRASLRASIANALMNAKFVNTMANSLLKGNASMLHYDLVFKEDDTIENIKNEYEVLGVMISSSPFALRRDYLKDKDIVSYKKALTSYNVYKVAGMITSLKTIKTKKNTQMSYISVANDTESMEVTVFPDVYSSCWQYLKVNNLIVIEGKKDNRRPDAFVALNIYPMEELK